MGAVPSKPQPGAKLRVIGAGLPRTGTSSFSAALEILLQGPIYHGGTMNFMSGDERHIKGWIDINRHTPYKSPEDKAFVLAKLKELVDGYVATVGLPVGQFVPELMELYPDAKIICSVRNPDSWAKSADTMASVALQDILGVVLFWIPCLRYTAQYFRANQNGRWGELYSVPGEKWSIGRNVWDRHIAYVERTVPKDRLIYYDVKEGWEPLCRALELPVPKGVEFPNINDTVATNVFAKQQIRNGLMRWALVIGATGASIYAVRRYLLK